VVLAAVIGRIEVEERLRRVVALDDCVRQGKVRYIGLSNFAAWQMAVADGVARRLGTERFCSAQVYYSLVGRDLERDIIPAVKHLGIGTMIYSPLAAGFLSGKYTDTDGKEGRRATIPYPPIDQELGDKVVHVLRDIGAAHGVSPGQVALRWVLQRAIEVLARQTVNATDELAAARTPHEVRQCERAVQELRTLIEQRVGEIFNLSETDWETIQSVPVPS